MKRLILALALLAAVPAAADAQKHLTFKGVEIDGTTDDMVTALGKKGFKYEETNNGVPLVIGYFAGYSDVEVNILPFNESGLVYAVRAEFPPRLSWVKLENDYTGLKEKLAKKYGKPVEQVEEFRDGPHEDSSAKLVSLIKNNCTYKSVFKCKEGSITIFLKHQGPICYTCLLYEDKLNASRAEKSIISDL